MKLSNTFQIDRPVDEVFDVFLDIERVATCMPGSRLTGMVDDSTFEGEVKIKVGPLAVAYNGQATFVDIDNDARRLTLRAKGREQRGAGNADALIGVQLRAHGGGTEVVIDTDLSIRGKVAQFGRGAIGEVAGGLMQQFAHNVETLLAGGGGPTAATAAPRPVVAQTAPAEVAPAESADSAALDGWSLIVLPLVRKALPTVGTVLASGVASYLGARVAVGRSKRRR
jgi:carbon monoxide dehydrogenase subunit G